MTSDPPYVSFYLLTHALGQWCWWSHLFNCREFGLVLIPLVAVRILWRVWRLHAPPGSAMHVTLVEVAIES